MHMLQANQKAEKAKEAASQAAPQEVKSKASRAVSKGKQSLAEAAPGSPDSDGIEEDFKEAVNTAKKSFFEVCAMTKDYVLMTPSNAYVYMAGTAESLCKLNLSSLETGDSSAGLAYFVL